ncbi:hypothetical protein LXL04_029163 [Taraxacum kok-saghyz]
MAQWGSGMIWTSGEPSLQMPPQIGQFQRFTHFIFKLGTKTCPLQPRELDSSIHFLDNLYGISQTDNTNMVLMSHNMKRWFYKASCKDVDPLNTNSTSENLEDLYLSLNEGETVQSNILKVWLCMLSLATQTTIAAFDLGILLDISFDGNLLGILCGVMKIQGLVDAAQNYHTVVSRNWLSGVNWDSDSSGGDEDWCNQLLTNCCCIPKFGEY